MRKASWSSAEIERLIEAANSQEFLKEALNIREEQQKPLSYAALSRAAGFVARSFPRDVIMGKKALSRKSAEALAAALKLPSDVREFFCAQVDFEAASRQKNANVHARAEKMLVNLKNRLKRHSDSQLKKEEDEFSIQNFSRVYASLGNLKSGSTLAEICVRSGLPESQVLKSLLEMKARGLVKVEGKKYRAQENHLAFAKLGEGGFFHSLYLDRLKQAQKVAEKNFSSEEMLFLESTFSVKKERLAALKSELRRVLLNFIDESEAAEGTDVVTLTSSFFSLKDPGSR